MSSLKKGLAGLVAVVALAVVALPASASTGALDAACVFTGHANIFASPVQYVGGGGQFGFDSQNIVCAGQHNGAPEATSSATSGLLLSAQGTYGSLVCGTSTLNGPATGVATLTDNRGGLGQSNFTIPFAAGQGVISGTFTGAGPYAGASGLTPGFVTIFPNNAATVPVTGGDVNHPQVPSAAGTETCVDNYGVAGAFAIVG